MTESRYHELIEAEHRIAACGCGGICAACIREPRPITDDEMQEFCEEIESRQ